MISGQHYIQGFGTRSAIVPRADRGIGGWTERLTLAFNPADFTILRIIYVRAATRNIYLSPKVRRYLPVYY